MPIKSLKQQASKIPVNTTPEAAAQSKTGKLKGIAQTATCLFTVSEGAAHFQWESQLCTDAHNTRQAACDLQVDFVALCVT
ncbi:hypothetical protein BaRGS_00015661 [Batillaria attramentaria]|uniref:Uncharacterized protein n=1 Tax=Batillaria attramentaria TaxID=370345 RepID=A0ABD0L176_9CAEN